MKIQYFSSDLSAALNIGQINEMHVETINGVPVLRIDCQEVFREEYKTMKLPVRKLPASNKKHAQAKKQPAPQTRDMDLGGKLLDVGKKWMSNKEKPNFMRDAGF